MEKRGLTRECRLGFWASCNARARDEPCMTPVGVGQSLVSKAKQNFYQMQRDGVRAALHEHCSTSRF